MEIRIPGTVALVAAAILLSTGSAGAFGFKHIHIHKPHIPTHPSIPSPPHLKLPTLPGLGKAEKPIGDVGVSAIQLNANISNFADGHSPSVNLPGIGKVNSMDSFHDGIIGQGVAALDTGEDQVRKSGLPVPDRGKLAKPLGQRLAHKFWKSKHLVAACIAAGKSCGALMTRLSQAAVDDNPILGKFCNVIKAVRNNRAGFGHGFNGTLTRNIRLVAPATGPVTVDFRRPRC